MEDEEIHRMAYAVLINSPHVAAQAYCASMQDMPLSMSVTDAENIPGKGICASVNGAPMRCGNARWLSEKGMDVPVTEKTAIHLAWGDIYLGSLEFSSRVKSGAAEAIAQLRESGVARMAILSGDEEATVREVASVVGVEEIYAGRMPSEKLAIFEEIYRQQKQQSRGTVAFCGDGLNDSAVIAASDVGIAMGRGGSAVTVEAADVVLMDDSPDKLPIALTHARRTVRIVNQNIILSFGMKFGIALICVFVLPSMELALIADVGAAVITVLNAVRAGKAGA